MTNASKKRIEKFVDDFIRGRLVEDLTSDRDGDFINEPERAARCYDAAEYGADGKTHAEVIGDWRDAFRFYMDVRNREKSHDRFESAVYAHFDAVEAWHEKNGTLWKEIG